jgi:hypothetical protein
MPPSLSSWHGVALTLALALVMANAAPTAVPLFMWSGQPYFAPEGKVSSDALTANEFRLLFTQSIYPKSDFTPVRNLLPARAPTIQPELVLAFVFNELSSGTASRESGAYETDVDSAPNLQFKFLKSAITSSVSSVTAPYFLPGAAPISEQMVSIHNALAPRAQVFATQIDGTEHGAADDVSLSGCDALIAHLDEHAPVFTDGQADLVLVKYSILDRKDTCMQRVTDHVAERTGGNFVGVFSADAAFSDAAPLQTSFAEVDAHVRSGNVLAASNNFVYHTLAAAGATPSTSRNGTLVYPGVKMITPDVFWALILGLIFFIAVTCGVCWIQSIEPPARFTTVPLQLAKEY